MSTEPVGSLAEEAAKLISVMQSWAAEHGVDAARSQTAARSARRPTGAGRPPPGANEPGHSVGGAAGEAADAAGRDDLRGEETNLDDREHVDHVHAAGTAAECRWCPLCQAVRMARATTPEVREHLASAALSLAMAAKGLLETVEETRPRSAPVEKIDLDPDPHAPED